MSTVRQLGHIVGRVVAGVAVIAIIAAPIVVMAGIAGNPFGGDLLDKIGDRRVDDATIIRLLSIAFYIVWAWFAIPALRQAQQCLNTRTRTGSRLTTTSGPAPADVGGPRGWLAQLVRYALTTTTLAATLTASSTLMLATPVGSTTPARAPTAAAPAVTVDADQPDSSLGRADAVSEVVAQRRDTPYSIAARLFPDRVDTARDEILTLNLGRPTHDGQMYRGGGFPVGMTVLTPEHHQPVDTASEPSGDGWLEAETVTVEPGDNVWNLATERLDRADGADAAPTQWAIAEHVDVVIDTNIFPSGDPNLIFPGDTIEFPAIGTPAPSPAAEPAEPQIETPPVAEAAPPPPPPAPAPVVDPPRPPATVTVNTAAASPAEPSVPSPTTAPAERGPEPARPTAADEGTVEERSPVSLAGITGAVVLASGLAATIVRQRRRRRARGSAPTRRSARAGEVAAAIVAAADVPFVRWAGQELAALARQLTPTMSTAAPVAVELDGDAGIEVLWDQPSHHAPPPWEATDGGWSWRVLYDPDEPTPLAEWPAPIPALVTVGTRDGRQLLIDLEHVGTLAVTGPRPDVDAWVRAVVLELGAGDELADAAVTTVGAGIDGVEHLERITSASPDEAVTMLTQAAHDAAAMLDGHATLFHRRLGPDPLLGMWTTVVVCGDIDPAEQARIAAAVPRRCGVAAIVTADIDQAGARLVLDGHGAGVLHGIGEHPMLIVPVGVPRDTAAELAVLLDHEHRTTIDSSATADLLAELEPTIDDNPPVAASPLAEVSFLGVDGAVDLDSAGDSSTTPATIGKDRSPPSSSGCSAAHRSPTIPNSKV